MVNKRSSKNWTNEHATVELPHVTIYRPSNITGAKSPRFFNGLDDLIAVAKEASEKGISLCAVGSTWSLSEAVAPTGAMVNTRYLGEVPFIGLDTQYSSYVDRECLVFCQAGVEIAQLNRMLASRDLSLQVSGASNGQTLVGAVSTGTHGSAFRIGGLAETVCGIHLVTKDGESLWIERKTAPVVKQAWADYLGARLIRDDELFGACLVSFGTFGLIHGMLIEAEPLYRLKRYRYRKPLKQALAGISRAGSTFKVAPELLPHGSASLYHFELLFNPNDVTRAGAIVQALYRAGTVSDYDYDDRAPQYQTVSGDSLAFVSHLINSFGRLIPRKMITARVKALEKQRYKNTGDTPEQGVLGELFPRTDLLPGGNSTEIGVDVNDARRAISTVLETIRKMNRPYPGLIGVRFVPQTQATLGFTRFPITCTIELPAADCKYTERLFAKVWKALSDEHIFFTLHWGQALDFARIPLKYMYPPSSIERFNTARKALLGEQHRTRFQNRMSRDSGLW